MECPQTTTLQYNGSVYLVEGCLNPNLFTDTASHIRTLSDMLELVKKESVPQFLKDLERVFNTYHQWTDVDENFKIRSIVYDDQHVHIKTRLTTTDKEIKEQFEEMLETTYVNVTNQLD